MNYIVGLIVIATIVALGASWWILYPQVLEWWARRGKLWAFFDGQSNNLLVIDKHGNELVREKMESEEEAKKWFLYAFRSGSTVFVAELNRESNKNFMDAFRAWEQG